MLHAIEHMGFTAQIKEDVCFTAFRGLNSAALCNSKFIYTKFWPFNFCLFLIFIFIYFNFILFTLYFRKEKEEEIIKRNFCSLAIYFLNSSFDICFSGNDVVAQQMVLSSWPFSWLCKLLIFLFLTFSHKKQTLMPCCSQVCSALCLPAQAQPWYPMLPCPGDTALLSDC